MKSILGQSAWLFLAQIFARVIGFFYTLFLARELGVSDFGLYSVALTYFLLFSTFAEFGFNRFLVREIAKSSKDAPHLLANINIIRLIISALYFIILTIILVNFDPDKTRVELILIATLGIFFVGLAQSFDAVFVSLSKLQYSATALIIQSIFTVFAGVALVSAGLGNFGAVYGLVFGQAIYLISILILLIVKKIKFIGRVDRTSFKTMIFGSLQFGILGILGIIYFRVDTILLSYLKGSFDTGLYSAAYKFLEASMLAPTALSIALFPKFIKMGDDKVAINRLYTKILLILFLISIPVVAGYFYILPIIISNFLPKYIESSDVIKILSLSIPFFFINGLQSTMLLSQKRFLNKLIFVSIFAILFNLILNFFLIPMYSFLAAAWLTVITEGLIFIVLFILIKRDYGQIR